MGFAYGGGKQRGGQISSPGMFAPKKPTSPTLKTGGKGSAKAIKKAVKPTQTSPQKSWQPTDLKSPYERENARIKAEREAAEKKAAADKLAALEAEAAGGLKDHGIAGDVRSEVYNPKTAVIRESATGKATADQRSIDAQYRAMDELFGLYNQGGATAADRAFAANARAESEQALRGQRDAWGQDLAERGMGSSGGEMAMMLGGMQDFGARQSKADLDMQAQHEARALDSLMKGGDLAGQARTSSFTESMGRGQGQDAIQMANQGAINDGGQAIADRQRAFFDSLQGRKLTASEGDKNRSLQAAGMGLNFDASENQFGKRDANEVGQSDVDQHTGATAGVAGVAGNLGGSGATVEAGRGGDDAGNPTNKVEDPRKYWI